MVKYGPRLVLNRRQKDRLDKEERKARNHAQRVALERLRPIPVVVELPPLINGAPARKRRKCNKGDRSDCRPRTQHKGENADGNPVAVPRNLIDVSMFGTALPLNLYKAHFPQHFKGDLVLSLTHPFFQLQDSASVAFSQRDSEPLETLPSKSASSPASFFTPRAIPSRRPEDALDKQLEAGSSAPRVFSFTGPVARPKLDSVSIPSLLQKDFSLNPSVMDLNTPMQVKQEQLPHLVSSSSFRNKENLRTYERPNAGEFEERVRKRTRADSEDLETPLPADRTCVHHLPDGTRRRLGSFGECSSV